MTARRFSYSLPTLSGPISYVFALRTLYIGTGIPNVYVHCGCDTAITSRAHADTETNTNAIMLRYRQMIELW